MTYSYTAGTNKISSISDAAMSTQGGFRAASGGFTYDANACPTKINFDPNWPKRIYRK